MLFILHVTCYTCYKLHMLHYTLCTGAAGVSALPHRGLRLEAGHGDGVGHHGPGGAAVQHAAEGSIYNTLYYIGYGISDV